MVILAAIYFKNTNFIYLFLSSELDVINGISWKRVEIEGWYVLM